MSETSLMQDNPSSWAYPRSIVISSIGSHAYGTMVDSSDIDIRGICVAPMEYYIGLRSFEQYIAPKPKDMVIFDIRKFFQLAMQGNPNIMEILFSPTAMAINALGEELLEWKEVFLSQRLRKSLGGYAYSELKKYEASGFQKHKSGAHCIRLLRMGVEVLTGQGYNVLRKHDAADLLAMRNGERHPESIMAEGRHLLEQVENVKSDLPRKPPFDKLELLLISLIREWDEDLHLPNEKVRHELRQQFSRIEGTLLDPLGVAE